MKVELWVGVAQSRWSSVIWIPMKWDPEGFEAKGRGLEIKQYQAQRNPNPSLFKARSYQLNCLELIFFSFNSIGDLFAGVPVHPPYPSLRGSYGYYHGLGCIDLVSRAQHFYSILLEVGSQGLQAYYHREYQRI
jgi:hypothetical protein